MAASAEIDRHIGPSDGNGAGGESLVPLRILCLGNDLLADDAFGFAVAGRIRQRRPAMPAPMEVVQTSLSGFALIDKLLNASRLVVVDTVVSGKAKPGTVYLLKEEDLRTGCGGSPHYIGLFEVLQAARKLGLAAPREMVIVAVEADDCTTVGGEMHPGVKEAIPSVVKLIEGLAEAVHHEEHEDHEDQKKQGGCSRA